jgi:REP element-mobilizing transposase RayT
MQSRRATSSIKDKKMGRSRYKIYNEDAPHFFTCTVNEWIPLFTRPITTKILLDALLYRQQHQNMRLYAYVILENHLHCIIQAENLNKLINSFKAHTARTLIDCLKQQQAHKILKKLAFHKRLHKKDRDYQIWEEGSHPQLIQNETMLLQKIDYIHNNPVKRGYVNKPTDWRYSSARNYANMVGLIPVYTEWWTGVNS